MEVEGYCSMPGACTDTSLRDAACAGCPFNHIETMEEDLKFMKRYYPVKVKING